MSLKVGVVGAAGRMGATVCNAVHSDDDLELVAAVDPSAVGRALVEVGGPNIEMSVVADVDDLKSAGAHVVVDFTVAGAARENLPEIARAGIHAVVGTTGFTDDDLATFESAFTSSNCVVAANFSISAVLMMRFAEIAAPFFDTAEIVEYHHNNKVDAPSGTAIATAQRIAAASAEWAKDPTTKEVLAGARGGEGPGGIRVHGVRMHGMLAHQDVIFGADGQALTIRQDSYDRSSFMPGVLLACKHIARHPGLTIGLDGMLEI
jgi:4-hydroxy-tetrahydrodipicolinate reductase